MTTGNRLRGITAMQVPDDARSALMDLMEVCERRGVSFGSARTFVQQLNEGVSVPQAVAIVCKLLEKTPLALTDPVTPEPVAQQVPERKLSPPAKSISPVKDLPAHKWEAFRRGEKPPREEPAVSLSRGPRSVRRCEDCGDRLSDVTLDLTPTARICNPCRVERYARRKRNRVAARSS